MLNRYTEKESNMMFMKILFGLKEQVFPALFAA